jgi:hypothetical protein
MIFHCADDECFPISDLIYMRSQFRLVHAVLALSVPFSLISFGQDAVRSALTNADSNTAWHQAAAPLADVVPATELSMNYIDAASTSTPTVGPFVQINPATDSNLHSFGSAGGSEVSAEPRRFQYGLNLAIRGVYDDNINISNTNRVSDYYFSIEPSLTLGFGGGDENFVRLDYHPSVFLFVDHSEDDAVQHLIRLAGQYRFSRLTLGLTEEIALLDGADLNSLSNVNNPGSHANLDVGGRTRVNIYTTRLSASYDLSGKTFLSGGADSTIYDYQQNLISSETISGNLFFNYVYSPKLVVGLGGSAGYDLVDAPNPHQTFEQVNARMSYQVTGKVSLNASGGVEFRQFSGSSRGNYVSPVFEIGASYQPFDGTSLSLSANRHILNSAVLLGQDYTTTNITLGVRQRLLQRVYVGLSAGYENANYFSAISSASATRDDNYYFIEPGVDVTITRFWTVGAYYLHRQNDSSSPLFGFYDNQVGFRTALTF